jgi:hypothetical protein
MHAATPWHCKALMCISEMCAVCSGRVQLEHACIQSASLKGGTLSQYKPPHQRPHPMPDAMAGADAQFCGAVPWGV